jgi:hypothetical protein
MSLFLEYLLRVFHSALSFEASHSTYSIRANHRSGGGLLTAGGSTKSPLGNGSLINTVYDGSELDMVQMKLFILWIHKAEMVFIARLALR